MKRPQGTHFCCHAKEQCEDCPMRAWDALAQARFVGSIKDGHWVLGDQLFNTYEELKRSE